MTDYEAKDPNACKKLVDIIATTLPPDDNYSLLTDDIVIVGSPSIVWYLNIEACFEVAGKFRVVRTNGTTTIEEIQNAGESLAAGASYRFTVDVSGGDSINFGFTGSDGTSLINKLRVSEVI